MQSPPIQPVILSGGSGSRLWPLSRPERPKQLLPLVGERTMLQLTAERVRDSTRYSAPIIVCGASHAARVEEQLTGAGITARRVIVEPHGRNTAPAIALAAASVAPGTLLLAMPSDHVVTDSEPFNRAVDLALPIAQSGWIVTFGLQPHRPETGFGYIRPGEPLSDDVHRVASFAEKPNVETAARYLEEGRLWNAGIFLFRAGDYLAALARHAPAVLSAASKSIERARGDESRLHPDAEAFAEAPSISIDYAVMEKTDRAAVAPVDFGWSDLGSWDAVYELRGKDERGNACSGDVLTLDAERSLIVSDGPTVAAIGVKDLMILVSGDSVLVVPRGESQKVREIADLMSKRGG